MQIIRSIIAGSTDAVGTVTAGGTTLLIPLATNVRGVIIHRASYAWFLGAVASQVLAHVAGAGANRCGRLVNTNGAGGPVNIPQFASFQEEAQFPGGIDINLGVTIVGTVRLDYAITYSVLT